MNKLAIYHKANEDWAYSDSRFQMRFKLRVGKLDAKSVTLITNDKYRMFHDGGEKKYYEMQCIGFDDYYDYYEAVVTDDVLVLKYYFKIIGHEGEVVIYGSDAILDSEEDITMRAYFDRAMNSTYEDRHQVPEWMKDAVVYQIFPERYYRGDHMQVSDTWYEPVAHDTKLGGTLKGIKDKLDYIKSLGANVIYLTPVFESTSSHKYNTKDYYRIDPEFGTNEDFKDLIDATHQKGMKIMIDGVFNHSGDDFFAFNDVREKGKDSPYYDWFDVREFPLRHEPYKRPTYEAFAYYYKMPKIMHRSKEARDYFLDVAKYWTSMGIDGWRLDVADEVSCEFWRAFRIAVRSVNSQAAIVGEVWYDSSLWLRGDQYDSVMNYGFLDPVMDFIGESKADSDKFLTQLSKLRGRYKKEAYDAMWNLIDSHDTARFLHRANEDKDRLKLAALVQMTYTGVPFIYYGDEAGITGGKDPDCRRGMLWHETKRDESIFKDYQHLIALRNSYKALSQGLFTPLSVTLSSEKMVSLASLSKENQLVSGHQVAAYTKSFEENEMLIVINMENEPVQIPGLAGKVDLVAGESFSGILSSKQGLIIDLTISKA